MIQEYAVEPEAVMSWKDFRYVMGRFGVHEGRVIAAFPRDWRSRVWKAM
jgi:hypothetical protein